MKGAVPVQAVPSCPHLYLAGTLGSTGDMNGAEPGAVWTAGPGGWSLEGQGHSVPL